MKDIARELLKVAKDLTARSRIMWTSKGRGDDIVLRVTVAFADESAWGDDIGAVLDKVGKQATDKLNTMMNDEESWEVLKGWTTGKDGIYMEYIKYDGGGVWERENAAKWR